MTEPLCCPFCGQPLSTEAAEHLRCTQAEFESSVRESIRAEAEAAARATLAKERDALRAEKAALQARVRKDVEREQAGRERQLERTVKALEQTVSKLNAANTKLQRRVEARTSNDLGEDGELDIYERLREAFPEDALQRRGEAGDILQEVHYEVGRQREVAGKILYECKNTARWSNGFLEQIRADGKVHRTPYLILVSRAFPRGENGICVKSDVVVVEPAHTLHLAEVVRQMVIETHRAGLRGQDQAAKTARVYEYLSTDAFRQPFREVVEAGTKLSEILRKERQTHERTWTRREQLYGALQRRSTEIDESIRTIIEAESSDNAPRGRTRARPGSGSLARRRGEQRRAGSVRSARG